MSIQRYAKLFIVLSILPAAIWWSTLLTQGLWAAMSNPWYWAASFPMVALQVKFWLTLD